STSRGRLGRGSRPGLGCRSQGVPVLSGDVDAGAGVAVADAADHGAFGVDGVGVEAAFGVGVRGAHGDAVVAGPVDEAPGGFGGAVVVGAGHLRVEVDVPLDLGPRDDTHGQSPSRSVGTGRRRPSSLMQMTCSLRDVIRCPPSWAHQAVPASDSRRDCVSPTTPTPMSTTNRPARMDSATTYLMRSRSSRPAA